MCLLLLSVCAVADVYKYQDKDGSTVYTDVRPEASSSSIESINVNDSYTNTIPASAVSGADAATNSATSEEGAKPGVAEITKPSAAQLAKSSKKSKAAAKKAVVAASKNLEQSKVVREGDMFRNPGAGIRYTQQYHQRVEAAQKRLNDAQKRYNKL